MITTFSGPVCADCIAYRESFDSDYWHGYPDALARAERAARELGEDYTIEILDDTPFFGDSCTICGPLALFGDRYESLVTVFA